MTRPVSHVAVVVPAANEEDCIAACLVSLRVARDELAIARPEIGVSVFVVLDGCVDATASIVTRFPDVQAIESTARSVGCARDLGSRAALAAATVSPSLVWTAHTDADSTVPPSWLVSQVRLAEAGAALVLGMVVPDLPPPALARWRALHAPVDGHPFVHGANLGVRGDALAALGGWPLLASHEDANLVASAEAAGIPIARPGTDPVVTSGRMTARAPAGFSSYLRALV